MAMFMLKLSNLASFNTLEINLGVNWGQENIWVANDPMPLMAPPMTLNTFRYDRLDQKHYNKMYQKNKKQWKELSISYQHQYHVI